MEALGCCLLVQGFSGPQQVEHSIQIHAFSLIVPNPEASVSKAGARDKTLLAPALDLDS